MEVVMDAAVLEAAIPLAVVAKQFGVGTLAVYKWKTLGRLNPHTRERIYAEFTWLPGGKWGMTRAQFDDFMRRLNEKP
jgi:hypothetical protein